MTNSARQGQVLLVLPLVAALTGRIRHATHGHGAVTLAVHLSAALLLFHRIEPDCVDHGKEQVVRQGNNAPEP